ncbi:MAG: hypothetical protein AABZ60_10975, partial [Planctomycetota bacterium]
NLMKKLALKVAKVVQFLKKKGQKGFQSLDVDIKAICKKAQEYFFLSNKKDINTKRKIFKEYLQLVKAKLRKPIGKISELDAITVPWNILNDIQTIKGKGWRYLLDVGHFVRTQTMKKGKILSLNLTAVACISKGKLDKKYEFGRQVQVGRIGGNYLLPLSTQVKMEDKKSLVPMVENHIQNFGQGCLLEVGTDKGFYSKKNIKTVSAMEINTDGVQRPAPTKAKPPIEITQPLRDRRAGIEPLLGHLKSFGLKKSKMKSDSATHGSVYSCALGFNTHQLLRHIHLDSKAG